MAIKGNNSTEKTVSEKSKYTGLADCKVLLINPNKKELSDIGIEFKEEPKYVGDDGRVRLDFWVETQNDEKIKTKMSLWLENKLRASNAGKPQWINKYGRTAWANTIDETLDWYLTDGARQAYTGEEDLHTFLSAFLNTKYDTKNKVYDECIIDNPEALFKGDFSELKTILNSFSENTVRLLFGVKDGKYQNIYNKFFEKTCVGSNPTKWYEAAVTADYGTFKADFQDDLTWKVYMPSMAEAPTADAEVTTTSEEETF